MTEQKWIDYINHFTSQKFEFSLGYMDMGHRTYNPLKGDNQL